MVVGFTILSVAAALSACSGSKPGPDDGGDDGGSSSHGSSVSQKSCENTAEFKACAERVVAASGVSPEDAASLEDRCGINAAVAHDAAGADVFEVARQAVIATCR
jgi:hypothetical protein